VRRVRGRVKSVPYPHATIIGVGLGDFEASILLDGCLDSPGKKYRPFIICWPVLYLYFVMPKGDLGGREPRRVKLVDKIGHPT